MEGTMNELQDTLVKLGLRWEEVWRLTVDRRERTLVVVAADGRKFTAPLAAGAPLPRVKAVKGG
jgi:hypothetical protein